MRKKVKSDDTRGEFNLYPNRKRTVFLEAIGQRFHVKSGEGLQFGSTTHFMIADAIRKTLPWRHRGSIRPNLPSSQKLFDTTQQNFISVVNRTLQGYLDQNLSIHKLHLHLSSPDSQPVISLLHKWFPIIAALNIKAFKLNFLSYTHDLPSAVFLAESLEELHLSNCKLSPVESVRFKCLRTLTLEKFKFDGGTFEKITWGCPLLRRLVLTNCWGLRNVRVSETASPGLKHFVLRDFERIEGRSIEIYVPNIETMLNCEVTTSPQTPGWSSTCGPLEETHHYGPSPKTFGPRDSCMIRWFQFIPFGGGRRMCPGASFAMVIVELVLANLALNCEFELPVGLKGEDLDMSEGEGITIHRKFPLRVIANCES
ncbi:cytochrome P450 [Striga asiatica]|uniref:Cytochrome P450 n=1 Tax=Striga asiatica TaxID=4170 RepID=A0A5A7QFY7_STRAF|nr:cytochrome P450 [Striga asiatica]